MNPSNRSQKQSARETQTRFCGHCGFAFPSLQTAARAQYKFCPGCRNPVQLGNHRWANIRVDDQGGIYADESGADSLPSEGARSKCMQFLARTPGGVAVSGVALATLGSGFVLAAVPLAVAGAAIIATGAAVVQTAVIGGVLMGIVVAYAGYDEAMEGVLKLSGVVVVAGATIVLAGAVIVFLAGIAGVIGTVLIAAGAIAVGAVGCHQLYLLNRKHGWTDRSKAAITRNASEQQCPSGISSLPETDPWAGINKLSLHADILEALRKPKHD